jgi:hypothetical protein
MHCIKESLKKAGARPKGILSGDLKKLRKVEKGGMGPKAIIPA